MRELIDLYGVMQHIPDILGLNLTLHGSAWQGGYYIDGTKHHKKDKLKVKLYRSNGKRNIYVYEQGGESLSITDWLQKYGGARDWKHAMDILRGNSTPSAALVHINTRQSSAPLRFVPQEEWLAESKYEYERSPLFVWMCGLYPEVDVRKVWQRYGVTVTPNGDVTFWYIDKDRNICHDKRIRYHYDGHRDKDFGCRRKFKVGDGYGHRCVFGAHLISGEGGSCVSGIKPCVVESEKTCLICALEYPDKTFVAVGGKNNIALVFGRECVLYPDMDAIKDWEITGHTIAEWWHGHDMGATDDVGDLVVKGKRKRIVGPHRT